MKKKLLFPFFIGLSLNLSAQSLELVKNVNPSTGLDYAPPTAASFYEFKNKVYYVFNDGTTNGLMSTDGTAEGTVRITASNVYVNGKMIAANDNMFFIANDGISGNELWVTDGTVEGTKMLKDQASGITAGVNMIIGRAGSNILYSGHDGSYNSKIWISDGTVEGTKLFKDNLPSGTGYTIKDKLYFFAGSDSGNEPWISDGTSEGTHMIKDIRPGFPSSNEGSGVTREFQAYNDKIYFFATDDKIAEELWETDGTEAGTKLAVDINPTGGSRARDMVVMDNKLYISAYVGYKPSDIFALVSTDGTQNGTTIIDTLFSANDIGFNHLTVFNNTLYLRDDHPLYGRELFKLVGNEIVLVKDIFTGQTYNGGLNFNTYADQPLIQIYDNSMFFLANISNMQIQLFKSDGTAEGTIQVGQTNAGNSAGSYMRNWMASSIGVFIINNTVDNGNELYKYSDLLLATVNKSEYFNAHISPNPVQENLKINTAYSFEEFEVYDVLGSLKMKNSYTDNLDVSKLERGVYIIKLINQQGVYQTTFLKD